MLLDIGTSYKVLCIVDALLSIGSLSLTCIICSGVEETTSLCGRKSFASYPMRLYITTKNDYATL